MGVDVAFWQQRAVPPLRLRFASADVSWVMWVDVLNYYLPSYYPLVMDEFLETFSPPIPP